MGDVSRVAVEPNLALFLVVHWRNGRVTYANLQALWTEVALDDFLAGDGAHVRRYLRLDYDLEALGPLLKEPQPHVHVEADGEPRFGVPAAVGDDVVGWFLDFVYRNFFYDDWARWAESCWDDRCRVRRRVNVRARLVEAFAQSKLEIIEANERMRAELRDLKLCLAEKRRDFFGLAADPRRAELLSHAI